MKAEEKRQRAKEFFRLVMAGHTYIQIAKKYGLTKQRVHQIVREYSKMYKLERFLKTLKTNGKNWEGLYKANDAFLRRLAIFLRRPIVLKDVIFLDGVKVPTRYHKRIPAVRMAGVGYSKNFTTYMMLSHLWNVKQMSPEEIASYFGMTRPILHTRISNMRERGMYFDFRKEDSKPLVSTKVELPKALAEKFEYMAKKEGVPLEGMLRIALTEYWNYFHRSAR